MTLPSASTAARARPPSMRIEATSAPVRISTPTPRQAAAIAAVIAPMPPITWPTNPCFDSEPPPSRWNRSPNSVPGS